jgi:dihydroxy-acid dehydratase
MKKKLRSYDWFGKDDKMGFVHRSWLRNQGYPDDYFRGRPVIGICNTWSELTPCNGHLRDFAEIVKRGVIEAGGFPLEFPVISLGETIMKPTTMLFRNLASMDTEESIRANPLDGVVLLTGCDKTTPSIVMGACSVDLPTIVVPGGPMLNGRFKGECLGSGSFNWMVKEKKLNESYTAEDILEAEIGTARSQGHCMSMGTCFHYGLYGRSIGLNITWRGDHTCSRREKKSDGTIKRQEDCRDGKRRFEAFKNSHPQRHLKIQLW